jgi:hypothetical protein
MGKDDLYFIVSTILALLALVGMDWKLVKGRLTLPQLNRRSVLFLCLILASIGLSTFGWYKSHHQNTQEIASLTARNTELERSNQELAARLAAITPCLQSAVSPKTVTSSGRQHQSGHHNIQQSGTNDQANSVTVNGSQTTNGSGSPIINGNNNGAPPPSGSGDNPK